MAPDNRFCQTCGKPAWETERVPRPFCQTDHPEEGLGEVQSVAGLGFFRGTNDESGSPCEVFVGLGVCSYIDGNDGIDLDNGNARDAIRASDECRGVRKVGIEQLDRSPG